MTGLYRPSAPEGDNASHQLSPAQLGSFELFGVLVWSFARVVSSDPGAPATSLDMPHFQVHLYWQSNEGAPCSAKASLAEEEPLWAMLGSSGSRAPSYSPGCRWSGGLQAKGRRTLGQNLICFCCCFECKQTMHYCVWTKRKPNSFLSQRSHIR